MMQTNTIASIDETPIGIFNPIIISIKGNMTNAFNNFQVHRYRNLSIKFCFNDPYLYHHTSTLEIILYHTKFYLTKSKSILYLTLIFTGICTPAIYLSADFFQSLSKRRCCGLSILRSSQLINDERMSCVDGCGCTARLFLRIPSTIAFATTSASCTGNISGALLAFAKKFVRVEDG